MSPIRQFLKSLSRRLAMLTAAAWVLMGSALLLAQEAQDAVGEGPSLPASDKKGYVYQYLLVALCIALGLILICQPRNRSEKALNEQDLAFEDR
jgi:hypothetical protein